MFYHVLRNAPHPADRRTDRDTIKGFRAQPPGKPVRMRIPRYYLQGVLKVVSLWNTAPGISGRPLGLRDYRACSRLFFFWKTCPLGFLEAPMTTRHAQGCFSYTNWLARRLSLEPFNCHASVRPLVQSSIICYLSHLSYGTIKNASRS